MDRTMCAMIVANFATELDIPAEMAVVIRQKISSMMTKGTLVDGAIELLDGLTNETAFMAGMMLAFGLAEVSDDTRLFGKSTKRRPGSSTRR